MTFGRRRGEKEREGGVEGRVRSGARADTEQLWHLQEPLPQASR